jgi:hypothetical protein
MAGKHRYRLSAPLREILSRARPAAPAPGCTVGFTDGLTSIVHRVTTEAFTAGRREGGRYVALCGARVRPVRLTAPARYYCPACERDT